MKKEKIMNEEEYLEAKMKLLQLQSQVAEYENLSRSLGAFTVNSPLSFIHVDNPDTARIQDATFSYQAVKYDVPWKAFSALAKFLHVKDWMFYMSTVSPGSNKPYVRTKGEHKVPRNFSSMSYEQLSVSGKMVDEMISIWNKYFMEVHKNIYYEDFDGIHEVAVNRKQ
jgi:hypothetical protein